MGPTLWLLHAWQGHHTEGGPRRGRSQDHTIGAKLLWAKLGSRSIEPLLVRLSLGHRPARAKERGWTRWHARRVLAGRRARVSWAATAALAEHREGAARTLALERGTHGPYLETQERQMRPQLQQGAFFCKTTWARHTPSCSKPAPWRRLIAMPCPPCNAGLSKTVARISLTRSLR